MYVPLRPARSVEQMQAELEVAYLVVERATAWSAAALEEACLAEGQVVEDLLPACSCVASSA